MKLTSEQILKVKSDLLTICAEFNAFRHNTVQYLTSEGLKPNDKSLDPFFLYEGGSDLTKQFHKDWQLASKIAAAKDSLSMMQYAGSDHTGFNLQIDRQPIEEVSKAFQYIPGQPVPNKWTGNKHSNNKPIDTLLLTFACNFDGSIRGIWASSVNLTHNPDGKTGDWTFAKDSENSGFSSLTLTLDIATRPSFQLIMGQTEVDYGIGNEPKKGLKILPDKFHSEKLEPTSV